MTSTLTAARTERAEEPARPSGPRRDIQGLRAFAVLAVVLDHLTGWPGGGFVGVDMFFVISGFLITGLLLREHERTDQISFVGFYQRRFKRIIPAAVLVIVVTVIASYLTFADRAFQQIKGDAVAAMFFVSNWRFESQEINYFNVDRQVSPLQHYWSLSIEEQFYFVWPWVMLAIFAVLLRRNATRRHAHIAVGAVMAAIVIASFAWAVAQTGSDSHSAYFSSLTRVWELGVGAFLAVAVTQLARIPNAVRPLLAWVGLAGMVASLWVISGDQGFPAPAAALPVLATALVIAAGTYSDGRQQRFLWPLTNPASNYVGDASYSLYLWHFPIIIIGFALIGDGTTDKLILATVIAYLSYFAYELYETPLRHARWTRRRRRKGGGVSRAYQVKMFIALTIATAALATLAVRGHQAPESALDSDLQTRLEQLDRRNADEPVPVEQQKLREELVAALGATKWPDNLDPSMDEAVGALSVTAEGEECGDYDSPIDVDACTWGAPDATRRAMLVGDSIAMGYLSTLQGVVDLHPEWSLTSVGTFDCAFMAVEIESSTDSHEQCAQRKEQAVAAINEIKPDVLFVSSIYSLGYPLGSKERQTSAEYQKAVQDELDKLGESVRRVVFLAAPPADKDPNQCYTRQSSPADCTGGVPPLWDEKADADQALAQANDGLWIDTRDWFCAANACPPFAGTTPMKVDYAHLTLAYQQKIVPVVDEVFVALKVLDSRA